MKKLMILGTTGTLLLCLFAGVAIAAIVTCTAGALACNGTDNADTITGSTSADTINAKGAGDTIYTQPYPFVYNSTYDNDVVHAGAGADVIRANDGDTFSSGTGDYIDCGKVRGHTGDQKTDTVYLDASDTIDNSCRDTDIYYVNRTSDCDDTLDNDSDGFSDYPDDTGCDSYQDFTETPGFVAPHPPQCEDGLDNDSDGFTDFAGGDAQCANPPDDSEAS